MRQTREAEQALDREGKVLILGLPLSQLPQWAAESQSHEETLGNDTKHKIQDYHNPSKKKKNYHTQRARELE